MALGSAVHKVLDAFYTAILEASVDNKVKQRRGFEAALAKAEATYDEIMAAGFTDSDRQRPLAEILFQWYFPNEPFVKQGWTILAAEKEFVLEYEPADGDNDSKRLPFIIDLIADDPQGKTVIIDHKVLYDFYGADAAAIQPQIPLYIAGLRALNYTIAYGAYNMLRNRKMKAPTLEQSIAYLPLRPTGVRVQRTFLEQVDVANEIMELKVKPIEEIDLKMHRVANKMVCQSCSFKDLCITDLEGGNTKLMIATEYSIRERKNFALASVENDEVAE